MARLDAGRRGPVRRLRSGASWRPRRDDGRRARECAPADLGPDAKEVAQHLERVRQHPQPRRLPVVPLDRHLEDPPALGARAGEQLDVEAPAVDRGGRQHRLDGLRGEQLEAALRVLDAGQHHRPDQRVEDAAEQMPVQRLADAHRARALPAADGDVALRRQHRRGSARSAPAASTDRHRRGSGGCRSRRAGRRAASRPCRGGAGAARGRAARVPPSRRRWPRCHRSTRRRPPGSPTAAVAGRAPRSGDRASGRSGRPRCRPG